MLKIKNRLLAVVMLLSFTALLVPKTWWHDCDHSIQHAREKSSGPEKQINQGVEKCAACDLHLPLLSEPEQALTLTFVAVDFQPLVATFKGSLHAFQLTDHSRGPPVKMT